MNLAQNMTNNLLQPFSESRPEHDQKSSLAFQWI